MLNISFNKGKRPSLDYTRIHGFVDQEAENSFCITEKVQKLLSATAVPLHNEMKLKRIIVDKKDDGEKY